MEYVLYARKSTRHHWHLYGHSADHGRMFNVIVPAMRRDAPLWELAVCQVDLDQHNGQTWLWPDNLKVLPAPQVKQ